MWVHITGELSSDPPVIVYEYQKIRHSEHPKEYYKDFRGVLVTDGLEQYHKLARETEGIENANCMAHARRHFANAVKAMGKKNEAAVRSSIAYQALVHIGAFYDLEKGLKELPPKEREKERKTSMEPLIEAYYAWVKKTLREGKVPPKGETASGLRYSLNQEKYLRVFLRDGEVPTDNGLNVYYYIRHLLTELSHRFAARGTLREDELEMLMPWSKTLPEEC